MLEGGEEQLYTYNPPAQQLLWEIWLPIPNNSETFPRLSFSSPTGVIIYHFLKVQWYASELNHVIICTESSWTESIVAVPGK